ncbi:MAG: hypothetical protein V4676_04030 [Bacteroidota bacterium]
MKTINQKIAWLLIAVVSICGMCSKNDEDNNVNNTPVVMQFSKGILATVGVNAIGVVDTIHFRNSAASGNTPSLFSYDGSLDYAASGWYVRPKDLWELINTGSNQWHIRNNAGYYMGYEFNANGTGNNKYTMSLDLTPGPNNLFVMNKTGTNNFYIQPVANKDVYLTSVVANITPPNPRHEHGKFISGTKQLWFLIP